MAAIEGPRQYARSPQLHAPACRKACAVHLLADSTSGVPGNPRDWMPSVCHVLVSSNSLRANRSSHGECRREPRTCPQWPRESCGHQPAPLSAPQWCRSCQRSLGPPGVVSCKLGQQDCTVLHRGRRWLHTTPAGSCHCLSPSRVRRTAEGCGWPSAAGSQVHRQECPWTELGAGWGIPSSQLFYGTHPWVYNGRSGTLHHDGSATHWTHKSQLGSHSTIFPWSSCSFLRVVGPPFVCRLFGCCRLPSPAGCCFPPPAVGPLWRPGPFLRWSLPLGIWLLFVTAWLPCLTAGGVVVLCRPHFTLSHGSKGLWPCVGFVFPLHHDACVVRVLSTTTLSYSSSMIQVPHWTPLKLHYCYSW